MIKFRLYSSNSSLIRDMIDLLKSVALGNFIFEKEDDKIICKVTNDVDTYTLRTASLENGIWSIDRNTNPLPTEEPTKSYSEAICELIDSLDGKSYDEGIKFLKKLAGK